jgi:hypothetical protein
MVLPRCFGKQAHKRESVADPVLPLVKRQPAFSQIPIHGNFIAINTMIEGYLI